MSKAPLRVRVRILDKKTLPLEWLKHFSFYYVYFTVRYPSLKMSAEVIELKFELIIKNDWRAACALCSQLLDAQLLWCATTIQPHPDNSRHSSIWIRARPSYADSLVRAELAIIIKVTYCSLGVMNRQQTCHRLTPTTCPTERLPLTRPSNYSFGRSYIKMKWSKFA